MNVLITGGSSGLGLALANQYRKKHTVTVLDVAKPKLDVDFVKCDLSKPQNFKGLTKSYDIIICNAGISASGNFTKIEQSKEEAMFRINTLSHIALLKKFLKNNQIKKKGKICFILSASEFLPWPVAISYAASKSALNGFANALESYLIGKKISVTRVYPGPMKTPHVKYYKGIAEGNGADPSDIAKKVIFGIQKRKRKLFPDTASKLMRFASFFLPYTLAKKMYKKYEKILTQ